VASLVLLHPSLLARGRFDFVNTGKVRVGRARKAAVPDPVMRVMPRKPDQPPQGGEFPREWPSRPPSQRQAPE